LRIKTSQASITGKCNGNPGFKPIASGGNGGSVQYWFVGYDAALKVRHALMSVSCDAQRGASNRR